MPYNIEAGKKTISEGWLRPDAALLAAIRETYPNWKPEPVACQGPEGKECGNPIAFREDVWFAAVCGSCGTKQVNQQKAKILSQYQKLQDYLTDKFAEGFLPIITPKTMATEEIIKTVPEDYRDFGWSAIPAANQPSLNDFINGKRRNCLFVGGVGSHKTSTAWGVMQEFLRVRMAKPPAQPQLAKVVFVDWVELLMLASASESFYSEGDYFDNVKTFDPRLAKEFVKHATDADLLVIDDVGVGTPKTDARLSVIYLIINERSKAKKPILMTTNASKDELEKMMGGRFLSRAKQDGMVLRFKGEDSRGEDVYMEDMV